MTQALALKEAAEARLRTQVTELEAALHAEKLSKISENTSQMSQLDLMEAKNKEVAALEESVAELEGKLEAVSSNLTASQQDAEGQGQTIVDLEVIESHMLSSPAAFTMVAANNRGLRCVLRPSTCRCWCETRLESRMEMFNPHFIYV